jgi:hypothetical protein
MSAKLETATQERRKAPRAKLPRIVQVRPSDVRLPAEVCTTANFSKTGFYFETSFGHYYAGMNVSVARNFRADDTVHREETAKITRVEKLEDGRWGVAIRIL